jgi:hypothetical protein
MSLAISAIAGKPPAYEPNEAKQPPTPTPTLAQQALTLATSGNSVTQIATALAIPTSQVDSTLGIQTPATENAATLVSLAAKGLSIHA